MNQALNNLNVTHRRHHLKCYIQISFMIRWRFDGLEWKIVCVKFFYMPDILIKKWSPVKCSLKQCLNDSVINSTVDVDIVWNLFGVTKLYQKYSGVDTISLTSLQSKAAIAQKQIAPLWCLLNLYICTFGWNMKSCPVVYDIVSRSCKLSGVCSAIDWWDVLTKGGTKKGPVY